MLGDMGTGKKSGRRFEEKDSGSLGIVRRAGAERKLKLRNLW